MVTPRRAISRTISKIFATIMGARPIDGSSSSSRPGSPHQPAGLLRHGAADCLQGGGFAGALAPIQEKELASVDCRFYAFHRGNPAVAHLQRAQLKQHAALPDKPL